jgi:hypothetical protein
VFDGHAYRDKKVGRCLCAFSCPSFDALLLQKILKQINASIERNTLYFSLKSIYIDFREITKARLAISVVFSSVAVLCSVFMICIP